MISRRGFVQLLGAGALAGCTSRPAREIVAYQRERPELTPGVPSFYASALVEDGFATGVVVETHEGRPTKLEGNPDHPASRGATRAIEQAAIMSLYDPQRIAGGVLPPLARMHLVIEPTTSPQVRAAIARRGVKTSYWTAFGLAHQLAGNALAFGRPLQTQLDLAKADVVVAFDFAAHPMQLAYLRQLADRRRVVDAGSKMSRIYALEPSFTELGMLADHRFKLSPSAQERVAGQLLDGGGEPWVQAIRRDLVRGGAVIAGPQCSPRLHALVAALNQRIGAAAVGYSEPIAASGGLLPVDAGETLVVVGVQPPIDPPPGSVYVGLHANELAARCTHVVPALHDLERWGAARAYDGTLTPVQPMIEPLFGGYSVEAIVGADRYPFTPAELARGTSGGPAPLVEVGDARVAAGEVTTSSLELATRPHPYLHDGRYQHNPWLRELPEPVTKVTWDATAQISATTARVHGLETGDVVEVGTVALPIVVAPGHADDVVTVTLPVAAGPITLRRTGDRVELAITQEHWSMEDRPVALTGELATLHADAYAEHRGSVASLIANRLAGPQWAMHIDLTSCTGCTACVMACASENNTPVVGKARVLERREMHWLRIDRYVDGDDVRVQPMACQHCEHAPCEYVCPTGATTHSPDGLNEMAYNRCVGTRFCANNCPYKVRRFNWFDFKDHGGLRVLGKNPDVTIRDRGVMEKCTYCVQRLRRAEIDARLAHTELHVETACQQVCPTQAISFGRLEDVASLRARPHSYAVLHDQGTLPRTNYLARIRNKNPELA